MKRTFLASAISILMMTVPMAAQHGGSPKPTTTHGAPAPKPTTHSSSPHTGSTSHGAQAPKTTTHAAQAPKTTTHASSSHGGATTHAHATTKASATTHGSGHGATKTTTHGSGHGDTKTTTHASTATSPKTTTTEKTRTSKKNTATTTTTPTTTTSTTTPTTTTTTTLSPVQQKLLKNTNLASKLQSRLPAGTDLKTAASGFRNLGQFVAAVNVSNNLGIPFAQLKTRMVDQGMSLGQAIQDARPATTDTTVVAHHAETDADDLIRTSEQTTATTKTKKPAKTTRGDR